MRPAPRNAAHVAHVAIFCGGRGSSTLIRELLRLPSVRLTLLVNAYDDGMSTGRLRTFLPGMLGPSDFRKNLAHLIELSSTGRYALSELLELRLPAHFGDHEAASLLAWLDGRPHAAALPESLLSLITRLDPPVDQAVREYLQRFLRHHAEQAARGARIEFTDCSVGNLVFAGAYLKAGQRFNGATRELSETLSLQADLLNVSTGENRVLVGLKEDGELLASEAAIVAPQSPSRIRELFLLESPPTPEDLETLSRTSAAERRAWLAARHRDVVVSEEAERALRTADIVVYGPGTQFSSLLPSYLTRGLPAAITGGRSKTRVFVANLREDNDTRGQTVEELVHTALRFLGDPDDAARSITHVLVDPRACAAPGGVPRQGTGDIAGARVVTGAFENPSIAGVHSGAATVARILSLHRETDPAKNRELVVYVDLAERSLAVKNLLSEFLELDWTTDFSRVTLVLNGVAAPALELPPHLRVRSSRRTALFSEVDALREWLGEGREQYFVSLTGDGEYRLRDVQMAARVLSSGLSGAVYGARNQSRKQFVGSLEDAYGASRALYLTSFLGAFGVSALCGLRFQLVFADPLTGFRMFDRAALPGALAAELARAPLGSTVELTRRLVEAGVEITEIPVFYRSYPGFTSMGWRFSRGLRNAVTLLR